MKIGGVEGVDAVSGTTRREYGCQPGRDRCCGSRTAAHPTRLGAEEELSLWREERRKVEAREAAEREGQRREGSEETRREAGGAGIQLLSLPGRSARRVTPVDATTKRLEPDATGVVTGAEKDDRTGKNRGITIDF